MVEPLSERLLAYLGGLTVSQGEGVGKPFRAMPWEADFVRGAFAPGVQVAALTVARGNGKTALCAAIGAAGLDGPLAQPRGQVIVAAASLNQARVLHDHVKAFLAAKHGPLAKANGWRSVDSPNMVLTANLGTGAELRAIASDPARAHGLAPSLVLVDEPAQHPRAVRDRLWAALSTALGKMPGSRAIVLGTRPVSGSGHYFTGLLDGGADYAQVHDAATDADPLDEAAWLAANPSLPWFPSLRRTIEREAKRAGESPDALASFRALRLNAGVPDVDARELVAAPAWRRCIVEEREAPGMEPPVAWGIDLASGGAMSAVAGYSLGTGALDVIAAFPSVPDLAERGRRDGVGDAYERMHARGELLVHRGHTVKVARLLGQARERFGEPALIASDYHRRAELRDALDEAAIPAAKLELRRGGFNDGAEDVSRFRRAVLDRVVRARPSLLLATAIGEARTISNAAGDEKLATVNAGGRRQLARDDAAAASILAVAVAERNRARIERPRGLRWAVAG